MAHNPKTVTGPIKMDSRKFLGALNESAEAKLTLFRNKIQEMGKQAGKNWKLTGLLPKALYIEDVDTHQHYVAVHRREKYGRVVIEGVTPVVIVENQKEKLFQDSCFALVEAIETNDQKSMATAFNRMQAQRFSSRAISLSGKVRTQDGQVRTIHVGTDVSLGEDIRPRLLAAIVESIKDRVIVENGRVVGGTFTDGKPIKLPVTKWSTHKLAARQMQEAAKNAYWSPGFQERIAVTATRIDADQIEDAVKGITPFLKENEEFTLLSKAQVKTLVENALAAQGVFNQRLCEDTALLVYRANLRVNRRTIVNEWRGIAKKAQHPQLLENVRVLAKTKNFETTYDKFLALMFEAISDREVTAGALATTLEVLRDRTPKIKESHELASKLNDLIDRLKEKEFDDNAIYEAEDFIATVQEELATGDDLQNFDTMPGDSSTPPDEEEDPDAVAAGDDLGETLGAEKAQQQPSIVINAPLISFGGDGSAVGGAGAPPSPGDDDPAAGDDDSLDALLGGADDDASGDQDDLMAGGADAAGGGIPGMESRRRRNKAMSEEWDVDKYGEKPWEKDDEDDEDEEEDDDPYKTESRYRPNPRLGTDYGTAAITDPGDVRRIAETMVQLASKYNLQGRRLNENLENLALAGFEATGMRVPAKRQAAAIDQVVAAFKEEVEQDDEDWGDKWPDGPDGRKRIPGIDQDDSFDPEPWSPEADGPEVGDGGDKATSDRSRLDRNPAESQYKWGTRRRKGARDRSQHEDDVKIEWISQSADGVLGEMAGIRFIFDHGGADPNILPVILSEDGQSEIPIPDDLFDSAFAAAEMVEGVSPAPFTRWLRNGLEQLRPLSEADMDFGPDDDEDEDGIPDDMEGQMEPVGGDISDMDSDDDMDPMDDTGADGEWDDEEMEPQSFGDDDLDDDDAMMGGVGAIDDTGEEDGLGAAVAKITVTPDGGLSVEVDPGTPVNGEPTGGGIPDTDGDGVEDGMDSDPMDPEEGGMEDDMGPVDSVDPEGEGMEDDMGGEEMGSEVGEEDMPDFDSEESGADDMEGDETIPPPGGRRKRPGDEFGEDEDITSPKSSKYSATVKQNPRTQPDIKLPPKTDDKLKGFEKVKKGDKSGTNPPTAKSRSSE